MNKYKVIKSFPFSPDLGTILDAPNGVIEYTVGTQKVALIAYRYPEYFQVVNEPLIHTIDGKSLGEGDIAYCIDTDWMLYEFKIHPDSKQNTAIKYFADKKNAERYLGRYKLQYSEHQVKKAFMETLGSYLADANMNAVLCARFKAYLSKK